jgi:hypothetical protein
MHQNADDDAAAPATAPSVGRARCGSLGDIQLSGEGASTELANTGAQSYPTIPES